MKFREHTLESGIKILLGKNEENNDELMALYKGKGNVILHTLAPGSPFCVIDSNKPTKKEVYEAAVACASKSQDWRDNKTDIKMHKFTGKDATKRKGMKIGCWTVKKSKTLNVKKADIEKFTW